MWIRSEMYNGLTGDTINKIINVNCIERISRKENEILVVQSGEVKMLCRYETEERTFEVFEKLVEAIEELGDRNCFYEVPLK